MGKKNRITMEGKKGSIIITQTTYTVPVTSPSASALQRVNNNSNRNAFKRKNTTARKTNMGVLPSLLMSNPETFALIHI